MHRLPARGSAKVYRGIAPGIAHKRKLLSGFERNPTIRTEILYRGFERDVPAGFLCYPVSQAADITGFKATIVPVGEDQAPLIEQTNEIVRRVNRQIGRELLPEATAMIPKVGRLPGIDGKAKMSKSLGNAIPLSASAGEIRAAVRKMYTDPNHLRVADPGIAALYALYIVFDGLPARRIDVDCNDASAGGQHN